MLFVPPTAAADSNMVFVFFFLAFLGLIFRGFHFITSSFFLSS